MNMKSTLASLALAVCCISQSASALNIVLTNDDGWSTDNIQVMLSTLKAAGHEVILSAPCTGQSGKGGAVSFLKPVNIDTSKAGQQEFCVGDTDTSVAFSKFTEGSPVMAALYGIDVAAPKAWGQAPDLVISGPNEGNNLGYLNNSSGTLGAAMIAIARGIPAIAVSAADGDAEKAQVVADLVVNVVAQLEAARAEGEPLLPAFTGLNINTPTDPANSLGIKFTDVGWNAGTIDPVFVGDLSQDTTAMQYVAAGIASAAHVDMATALTMAQQQYAGKGGVSISMAGGLVNDTAETSEGVALSAGYTTISTIDAHIQASRAKVALTKQKLNALAQ